MQHEYIELEWPFSCQNRSLIQFCRPKNIKTMFVPNSFPIRFGDLWEVSQSAICWRKFPSVVNTHPHDEFMGGSYLAREGGSEWCSSIQTGLTLQDCCKFGLRENWPYSPYRSLLCKQEQTLKYRLQTTAALHFYCTTKTPYM